ncbi:uncharacterized protein mRpL36 [Drosophila tropicalis]|uniref:uncharacterized protein mRpL36 n=1 Tax=Drosophila tropicalis TaxID=46794 RepID=UPI0035AC149E
MSFSSKLLQQSCRLWQSVNSTCRFHMLTRPAVISNHINCNNKSNQLVPSTTGGPGGLLLPFNSLLQQIAGFKVKGRLKRRCKDCYIVVRQERGYVICPTHPRHKQMSMKKRDYKSWILTHATQSKERGF